MKLFRIPPHQNRSQEGASAIELLVVIVILGALAAIGTTAILAELRGERVVAASNELAGWLESVRRSSERGIPCNVAIPNTNAATNTTPVATAAPATNTIGNNCLQNIPFRIDSGRAIDRYSINSNINNFSFTPRGSVFVPGGGNQVIQITIRSVEGGAAVGTGRSVRVEPPLGLIETGPPEIID